MVEHLSHANRDVGCIFSVKLLSRLPGIWQQEGGSDRMVEWMALRTCGKEVRVPSWGLCLCIPWGDFCVFASAPLSEVGQASFRRVEICCSHIKPCLSRLGSLGRLRYYRSVMYYISLGFVSLCSFVCERGRQHLL